MTTVTMQVSVDVDTDVTIDLADLDAGALVTELRGRGYRILAPGEVEQELDEAAWRLGRGELGECLLSLSRLLGRPFRELGRFAPGAAR